MNEAEYLVASQSLITLAGMLGRLELAPLVATCEQTLAAPPPRILEVLYGEGRLDDVLLLATLAQEFQRAAQPVLARLDRRPLGVTSAAGRTHPPTDLGPPAPWPTSKGGRRG